MKKLKLNKEEKAILRVCRKRRFVFCYYGDVYGAYFFFFPTSRNHILPRERYIAWDLHLHNFLIVFPLKANKGLFGLDLGSLTPLFVIFFNITWGIKAAYIVKIARNDIAENCK